MKHLLLLSTTIFVSLSSFASPPPPPPPTAPPTCSELLEAANADEMGLSKDTKDRIHNLFVLNTSFASYLTQFIQVQIQAEVVTQVTTWLSPEARQNLISDSSLDEKIDLMMKQAESLDREAKTRTAAKRKKLKSILEILSFTRISEEIPESQPFYQSMGFVMIDGKFRGYDELVNFDDDSILKLLQFMEGRIVAMDYGLNGLMNDPSVIEKMKVINQQYAQGSSGGSIFYIP